jgi:hypothetical protein
MASAPQFLAPMDIAPLPPDDEGLLPTALAVAAAEGVVEPSLELPVVIGCPAPEQASPNSVNNCQQKR